MTGKRIKKSTTEIAYEATSDAMGKAWYHADGAEQTKNHAIMLAKKATQRVLDMTKKAVEKRAVYDAACAAFEKAEQDLIDDDPDYFQD